MALALEKTHTAMPEPNVTIACGTCAISGGIYADSAETSPELMEKFKPDLFIPGCPPHPATTLDALVRLCGILK
jgi:Ni,Fe-hydrogenase III small subunit